MYLLVADWVAEATDFLLELLLLLSVHVHAGWSLYLHLQSSLDGKHGCLSWHFLCMFLLVADWVAEATDFLLELLLLLSCMCMLVGVSCTCSPLSCFLCSQAVGWVGNWMFGFLDLLTAFLSARLGLMYVYYLMAWMLVQGSLFP